MKNKFILCVCSIISASIICCSCSGRNAENTPKASPTPVPIYTLMPADILTAENLSSIITYTPVCDNLQGSQNEKAVFYRSEPIGMGDPVEVKVYQYSETVSKDSIKAKYDAAKAARPSAEDITLEGGFEGFIAFPSVNIYRDGYYISITAGSGSGDEQKQLLTTAAQLAVGNLKMLLGENTESGNISENTGDDSEKSKKAEKPKETLAIISLGDENNNKNSESDKTAENSAPPVDNTLKASASE